jgi:pimeloyl-ACP methyl ester carboxylesterase
LPTRTINIAGIELELHEAGEGPPLLWLHDSDGFRSDHGFVEPLAARRRLVAPSHPGFGRSALPDWLDSVDDIAHVYLELVEHIGAGPFDLVGCSIGGWIAAEIATKIPQRIRRMALVGPVGVKVGPSDRLDVPDIFAMSDDRAIRLLRHDPSVWKFDPKSMSDAELSIVLRNRETWAMLGWEPWMHNPKLRHRIHRATMPALLVRGESDGFVTADYLGGYAALLPNARIATIPKAAHAPHLEQPQLFTKMLLEFLDA